MVEVPAGTPLTLQVANQGVAPHNLALHGGPKTPDLKTGQRATLEVGTVTRSMTGECSIPGHKEAGMTFEVRVAGAAPAAAAAAEHADAALDDSAKLDPNAAPPAAWRAYSPSLAPAPGGREHKLTLTATEGVLEVAPGVKQQMWSFEGKVPGPALRGKVGDLFTLTLVNDPKNKLGHSIDFHAPRWPGTTRCAPSTPASGWSTSSRPSTPASTCTTAAPRPPCTTSATACTARSSSTRLTWPKSTTSTCWSSPSSTTGRRASPDRCARCRPRAGRGGVQRLRHPVQVPPHPGRATPADPRLGAGRRPVGEQRLPHRRDHLRHDYKEGEYLLQPGFGRGGAQVLDLQPAQGGFVEFSFDEPGLYPIVTHKFANVAKGALGLFQAGEVKATGGGH